MNKPALKRALKSCLNKLEEQAAGLVMGDADLADGLWLDEEFLLADGSRLRATLHVTVSLPPPKRKPLMIEGPK